MNKVEVRPFLPTSGIDQGPQQAFLSDLVRALIQTFGRQAQRVNSALPNDGSELQEMSAMSHVTLAEFTAQQDDLDIGQLVTIVRMSSDATQDVTGIAGGDAPEASEGRVLILMNVGINPIRLMPEDVGSAEPNRFKFAAARILTLTPDDAVKLWWDVDSNRWRRMQS